MLFDPYGDSRGRKNFTIRIKKVEWLTAAHSQKATRGLETYLKTNKFDETVTSKCRKCHIILKWGDRSYEFDHKNNNHSNNSQNNCYLVCRNCHGKATKIDKIKEYGLFGEVIGHKTIKRKVSYKKVPKEKKTIKTASSRRTTKLAPSKAKLRKRTTSKK